MLIRRLDLDDATAYRALRLRGLLEQPQAFTSSYEEDMSLPMQAAQQRLSSATQWFWGAFDDAGQLVGIAGLERESRAKSQHKAQVVGMYVAPEQARAGVGRALLDAVVREAPAAGIDLLLLTVTEGNAAAVGLYHAAGFRSFGIEPRAIQVDGHFYDKLHMVLDLSTR